MGTVCPRRALLGIAGLIALCGPSFAQPGPHCPRAPTEVVEHFIAADCESCWQADDVAATRHPGWRFDWILPAASGDAAALAVAAIDEAQDRATRAAITPPTSGHDTVHRIPLTARHSSLRLELKAGPAWNGYIALQYRLAGRAPSGSQVWLALVEQVEAGADGTPIERALVRTVAGPFAVVAGGANAGSPQIVALRVPQTPQPQRLAGRAWIETPAGSILALATEHCAWPAQRRPTAN